MSLNETDLPEGPPPLRKDIPRSPDVVTRGTVFMDADLRVLAADSLFYASFNVKPEETEGRLLQDLGDGQWSSPVLRQLLLRALTEDLSFTDHEVAHTFPNGVGQRSMLLHGSRTGSASHPEAQVMLAFDDNAARRKAVDAMRHAEVRYRRLFQTAKDGILILDALTGKIIDANAFMEGLVGLESGELLGKQLHEIGMFKDTEQNKEAFRELQRARYIRYEHLPVVNRNGGTVEVEFIANVYFEGDRLVAQCNVRDISERVRLEKQIAQQATALADEARSKDQFLAMLSHELRNPLAPIRSAVHLLKLEAGANLQPIQREALDIIDRQVGNMTELVSDLLEVSRVINGRIHLAMQTVDVQQVLRHAIETTSPLVEKHRHTLTMIACTKHMWTKADPRRLEEVFVNLITNAAKYTPEGGRIEVGCASADALISIAVSDNGIGIAPDMLSRVFDLFTQADRSLERSQGGLGIGLSLAHRLVELQGGSMRAASDGLGKGSTFTVRLPMVPGPTTGASKPSTAQPHNQPQGSRVLVVDDNVDLVTMLSGSLRHKGYLVLCAYTGPEGLLAAEQWLPDIVLLDIGLPGLDGYEVARRLRKNPATAHARLIALTGYGQDSDIALTQEAGFDAHLVKPYAFDALEKLMRQPRHPGQDRT